MVVNNTTQVTLPTITGNESLDQIILIILALIITYYILKWMGWNGKKEQQTKTQKIQVQQNNLMNKKQIKPKNISKLNQQINQKKENEQSQDQQ